MNKNIDDSNGFYDFGGRSVVFSALTGSHNYNLDTLTSDKDYKFFVTPTFEDLYNGTRFSSAKQSDKIDYSVHDIRSLVELIFKSNINFLEVLFSVEKDFDPFLHTFIINAENIAAMNLPIFFKATYGMAMKKFSSMDKGTAKTDVLIERFGYDTKQACHALRCLFILQRYAKNGSMKNSLWFDNEDAQRNILLAVKSGAMSQDVFNALFNDERVEVGKLRSFYESQSPNVELKEILDNYIKHFIKHKLFE